MNTEQNHYSFGKKTPNNNNKNKSNKPPPQKTRWERSKDRKDTVKAIDHQKSVQNRNEQSKGGSVQIREKFLQYCTGN